ncbi:MAG: hypothetical protein QM679_06590 [Patulibacter sp.]
MSRQCPSPGTRRRAHGRRPGRLRGDGGFSLIEAMFAMLLLMTVAVGVYGGTGGGLFDMLDSGDKASVAQQQRAIAAQIASSELDRLSSGGTAGTPTVITRSGFSFTVTSSLTSDGSGTGGGKYAATCDTDAYIVQSSQRWQATVDVTLKTSNTSTDGLWADGDDTPVSLDGVISAEATDDDFTEGYFLVYVQDASGNPVDGATVNVPTATQPLLVSSSSSQCLVFAVPAGTTPTATVTAPAGMVIDETYTGQTSITSGTKSFAATAASSIAKGKRGAVTVRLRSADTADLTISFITKRREANGTTITTGLPVKPDSFMFQQGSSAAVNTTGQTSTASDPAWNTAGTIWDYNDAGLAWPESDTTYQAWAGSETSAMSGASASFTLAAEQDTVTKATVNVPSVDVRAMSGLSSSAAGSGVSGATVRLYKDANSNKVWDSGETYWDRTTDSNGLLTDPSVPTASTTLSACVFSTQPQKLIGVTKWTLYDSMAATVLSPIMVTLVSAVTIIQNIINGKLPGVIAAVFTTTVNVIKFVLDTLIPTFINQVITLVKSLLNPIDLIAYLIGTKKATLTKSLGSFPMPVWVNLSSVPVAVAAPGARQTAYLGLPSVTIEFPAPSNILGVPTENPFEYYETITTSAVEAMTASSTPCM